MSGNKAVESSVCRLVAVTICINYSDYLESVLDNRRHFDRWIIMTASGDVETQRFCELSGLECCESGHLNYDGSDFDAVDNKAPVINEAIDRILQTEVDSNVWCVVLDADIYLPRHFGKRVRAMPLDLGCLYATYGRRECETREQFVMLQHCEPWRRSIVKNSQALGYFNLFSLASVPNRYPLRSRECESLHDDDIFTRSFPADRRRVLPFSVLHLGRIGVDWHGRRSGPYTSALDAMRKRYVDYKDCSAEFGSSGTAVVLGCFPSDRLRKIVLSYSKVIMVDDLGMEMRSGDPIVEADRAVLRSEVREHLLAAVGTVTLTAHTVDAVENVPDGTVALLLISGEVCPHAMVTTLPYWLPKLRDGAYIYGDAFGITHFPKATHTVSLLLGTPDRVYSDGCWLKRHRTGARALPCRPTHSNEGDGLIFLIQEESLTGPLALSLHSARRYWDGPIQVWHEGIRDESLHLLCARLRVAYFQVGDDIRNPELLLADVCTGSSFRRSVVLYPGDLLTAKPRFDSAASGAVPIVGVPALVLKEGSSVCVYPTHYIDASEFSGTEDVSILTCSSRPDTWTEPAWEMWCEVEAEATILSASEVRVAENATVLTLVRPEDVASFQRNWMTWKIRSAPIIVILVGIPPDELWLPGCERATVLHLDEAEVINLSSIIRLIFDVCETPRVLLLSSQAAALPGAELWPDAYLGFRAIYLPTRTLDEVNITNNRFLPKECIALLDRGALPKLAAKAVSRGLSQLSDVICEWAIAEHLNDINFEFSDVAKMGWEFPEQHKYLNIVTKQPQSLAIARREKDGLLRLADDVVVISLPGRIDRRKKISDMMAREAISFRFVDGVRVADKEILPAEVSEVGKEQFKMAAGFQKYLRGMVGCRRAHLRELELAHTNGLESLLIMEDDAVFGPGWLNVLSSAIADLPDGWFQLYLSAWHFRRPVDISPSLQRVCAAHQTTAILYSQIGISAALNCLNNSRCEIDHWYAVHLHPFGNSYATRPGVAFQDGGVSDIMSVDRGITP